MSIEEPVEETNEENTVHEVKPQQQTLSIQDLTLMVNILEVVSNRGAIKTNEMELVGKLYNNLVLFLKENGVIANQTQEDAVAHDAEKVENEEGDSDTAEKVENEEGDSDA